MKESMHLDTVDRRIAGALQSDATLSAATLAESAGASSVSCWRRIKAMEAYGLFRGTVRLIDPAKIGLDVTIFCHVRLRDHGEDIGHAFEVFVVSRAEIVECYSMSGDWDYLLRIVAEDVGSYERFLMRVLLKQPMVATASSQFALRQAKYTTALPL